MPDLKNKKMPQNGRLIQFPANNHKPDPDKMKEQIIEFIKDRKKGCPAIADALGKQRLEEIAEKRNFEDVKKITESLNSALIALKEGGHDYAIRGQMLGPKILEKLYDSPAFKSEQLSVALTELVDGGEDFRYAVEKFISVALDSIGMNVLWKPLVDELLQLDGVGAASYFLTGEHVEYIKRWDERIALLDEARERWGLDDYIKIRGGSSSLLLREGERFETSSGGTVYAPAYVSLYPDKEKNMTDYRISTNHECGHHRWRSFRLNFTSLQLGTVGAEFLGEGRAADGRKTFRVAYKDKDGNDSAADVTRYAELIKIVKYPKLLAFLHNVADDRRVDALNMLNVPGLAEDYTENINYLLTKRPKLEGSGLGAVLEGLLQITVAGKTNGKPDEKLKKRLREIEADLADMEIHTNTDGTDSMNVALRWYKRLEPELDELSKRVNLTDEELQKLMPQNFTDSATSLEENDVRLVNEDAGTVIISRKKGKRPKPGKGIDPFSFLNFDGKFEDKPEEGEAGEVGEGRGKPTGARTGSQEGKAYDEWSGSGYRRGTKFVVEKNFGEGKEVSAPKYLVEKVKRLFRKYIPKEGVLERGLEAGEIDPELLEEYVAQVDAGRFPEPLYHADVVYERSNAVFTIAIDLSDSMYEGLNGKLKVDVAAEGGALLAVTANILRYPVEAYGFTGGDAVDFFVLPKTKYSITVPSEDVTSATPMAGAVRHATARTIELKKKSGRRFAYQFWVCDGQPNCSGEGMDSVVDTGKAIEEARAKGIRTFGIIVADEEIKKQLEEDYRKIFGPRDYVVTTDVHQIPELLLGFLKRIIYYR
jgi:hypothetical protein